MTIKEYVANRLKCHRFWMALIMLGFLWWIAPDKPLSAWGFDTWLAVVGANGFFLYYLLRPHVWKGWRDE